MPASGSDSPSGFAMSDSKAPMFTLTQPTVSTETLAMDNQKLENCRAKTNG
jgi:hypothetical protein